MMSAELDATYENVSAVCPQCGRRNIYNRATDLKDFVYQEACDTLLQLNSYLRLRGDVNWYINGHDR